MARKILLIDDDRLPACDVANDALRGNLHRAEPHFVNDREWARERTVPANQD